jgi:hypothetical protein
MLMTKDFNPYDSHPDDEEGDGDGDSPASLDTLSEISSRPATCFADCGLSPGSWDIGLCQVL